MVGKYMMEFHKSEFEINQIREDCLVASTLPYPIKAGYFLGTNTKILFAESTTWAVPPIFCAACIIALWLG